MTTKAQQVLAARLAMGYTAEPVNQAAVDQFLGTVPANAPAAMLIAAAERFEGMIAQGQTTTAPGLGKLSPETLAAIADALRERSQ